MNEWERLHQQAKRYQTEYPPGTRIMLLSMGRDPNPVEDQTRGTVKVGRLDETAMEAVNEALAISIGIEQNSASGLR